MNTSAARGTRDRGFTLTEVLVVVLIVGVLAAVATPVYLNQRKKAVDASIRADIKSLVNAEETWAAENPHLPATEDDTELARLGFRKTRGNRLGIAVSPTTGGYCIIGRNLNASTSVNEYLIYDSTAGGWLNGGRAYNWSSASPPGSHSCVVDSGSASWTWQP